MIEQGVAPLRATSGARVNADVGHEDEQERTSEVVSGPDLLRGRGHTRIGIAARCIQSHHVMDRSRYWMAHGGRRGNPVV